MSKVDLTKMAKGIRNTMKKHSPEILTGLGISGMVVTVVVAVRATPKALAMIEQAEIDKGYELAKEGREEEPFTTLDAIKAAWTCYIPAAVIGSVSIACLIGANTVNARRHAALATAYALSESTLTEYQSKVKEEIGAKKEGAIRDAIAKDRIDKDPVKEKEVIETSRGETLCYDVLSGRYFKSDIEKIRRAVNDLNRQMRYDMYVSLNEFYYLIGLDGIKIGDDLGWNIDSGYMEPDFRSQLTEDGTPCLVLDYQVAPRYDYR